MDNELTKADQTLNLVKPLPNIVEALCANALFMFRSVQEVATPECKAALLQNIKTVRSKLDQLETLLD